MRVAAIIALCIVACIVYGILHDQVTARICVEYLLTDLWAHTASYISGFVGGAIACYVVLRDRANRAFEQKHPGRKVTPSSR